MTGKIPQAFAAGFASRLRLEQTSLFISTQPVVRTNKRAAANAIVNYAEIEEDFDDDEDDSSVYSGMGSERPAPAERKTETKRLAHKTKHIMYTEQQLQELAETEEVLVPIRLNLEAEGYRVTDFFMWNMNETVMTPEAFAIITCQDFDLPVGFTHTIASSIKNQLQEYSTLASVKLPPESGIHVILQLSVNLDKQLYEDKVEWEFGCELSPETFAKTVVSDMGLSGEFYPAIAHAVHEMLLRMKKEAMEGHLPHEVDNQAAFGADAGWRVDQELLGDEWGPSVETLTSEEIERREIERERNIRRLKRESARMGDQITDIGGLFGRSKRRRRYDDRDSPGSPAYW
jgi:chromatin structure-remodeling complex subunit SFH1